MTRRVTHTAFDACHAVVPATCFSAVIALSVLCVQPVLVGLSLAGALSFSLVARGARSTLRGLRWQLPMLALVCLANPLFSASGSTRLLRLGPASVYLESLAYGACMGALMVAVVLWSEGAAHVLTQDRLLSLGRGRASSVALVVSMATQLAPQFLRRSGGVRAALDACTAAAPAPSPVRRLTRAATQLMAWSLEDSLERADAMRARGWGCGRARTRYRPDALCGRDALMACAVALLALLCALLAAVACGQWRFYPTMPRLVAWWGYVPYAALMLLPSAAALAERALWRSLR